MSDFKKPSKLTVVRYFISEYSAGATNLICHGFVIPADNKELKKYINPYEKIAAYANGKMRLADLELDNEPVSGYQFVYSNKYHDKSLYWIMHPEGFRFVISSMQYRDLVNSCTIINGKIQDGLFFDNNMNLMSENTTAFKNSVAAQKRQEKNKEVSSELTVGCTLIHKKDSRKLVYCGKVHFLSNSALSFLQLKKSSSAFHVFHDEVDDRYIATSNTASGTYDVSTSLIKKIDINDVVDKCNIQIKNKIVFGDYKFFSNSVEPILASLKKINIDKNLEFEYTNVDKLHFIRTSLPSSVAKTTFEMDVDYPYITEKNGTLYRILGFEGTVQSWRYTSRTVQEKFTYDEKENYGVWGYPVTLDENGIVQWDIDVSKHRRLQWNSIFTQSNSHKSLHSMHFLGYVNNIQIQIGKPKEKK